MFLPEKQITDKLGRTLILRCAQRRDAADLIELLRLTSAETPYMVRDPEEVTMTAAQEEEFIEGRLNAKRELMLVADLHGKKVGLCSFYGVLPFRRCAHRCVVSIALRREYCGCGIGRQMLEALLEGAREAGYEQAELEVVSGNTAAIALYESLGFEKFGCIPRDMKYADGSYADADWMMKRL